MRAASSVLRIGALARGSGLSADTLRHYERLGLLPTLPRTSGRFRQYPADALRRVRVIQAALAIGFSLPELREVFRERAAGRAPCARVQQLAEHKLHALERELAQLGALRDVMRRVLDDWSDRRRRAAPGKPAGLLDSLADTELGALPRRARPRSKGKARD